jgi:hypothetical protein
VTVPPAEYTPQRRKLLRIVVEHSYDGGCCAGSTPSLLLKFPGLILDPPPISRKVEIQLSGSRSSTFEAHANS